MADLTPDRLQELRRIAEAATPGPWRVNKYGPTRRIMSIGAGKYGTDPVIANVETFWSKREQEKYGDHGANAVHIATFDPPTVLALLDEIERLRRERDVLAEALRHVYTCENCECELCPQCTEIYYRSYRALGEAMDLLDGEEIVGNVTRFVLYDPDLNWWECQACRFWWEFEIGDPYEHD